MACTVGFMNSSKPATTCTVSIQEIPPQQGYGQRWFEAFPNGACGDFITWKINNFGAIATYSVDPYIAFMGGQTGDYEVCVAFAGAISCINIHHDAQ